MLSYFLLINQQPYDSSCTLQYMMQLYMMYPIKLPQGNWWIINNLEDTLYLER